MLGAKSTLGLSAAAAATVTSSFFCWKAWSPALGGNAVHAEVQRAGFAGPQSAGSVAVRLQVQVEVPDAQGGVQVEGVRHQGAVPEEHRGRFPVGHCQLPCPAGHHQAQCFCCGRVRPDWSKQTKDGDQ